MKKNAPEKQETHIKKNNQETFELPFLPLRESVIFPNTEETLLVGRKNSRIAVKEAKKSGNQIIAVTQQDPNTNAPTPEDLHKTGTIISIQEIVQFNENTFKVTVRGLKRVKIIKFQKNGKAKARIALDYLETVDSTEQPAFFNELKTAFCKASGIKPQNLPKKLKTHFKQGNAPELLKELCKFSKLQTDKKQELLEIDKYEARFASLILFLNSKLLSNSLKDAISEKVRKKFETAQKELLLNEQIKEIRKELGHSTDEKTELDELNEKVKTIKFSIEAKKKFEKELKRLSSIPSFSPEAGVIKGYLDWMSELPWNKYKDEEEKITTVAERLNKSHFGLTDVKERIMEFVAVNKLAGPKSKGSILCLTGPPGTGKTTLAMSIAEALDRNFVRASLGGLRDEAEIRGHRRTYVGAMPGKIIQSLRKAGSANPVFLLDEIDKMGKDHRGDPAAALLEVLDPEINASFQDNYLEVDFDLSKVFFITTSNAMHTIPAPLRDRMEVIHISGYTRKEKLAIARSFLWPKLLIQSGIKKSQLKIYPAAINAIIEEYTREAGVRNLERFLQQICRKIAYKILSEETGPFQITIDNLAEFIGQPIFKKRSHKKKPVIGLAKGLAWTESGGQILDIEARCLPGKGQFILTGQLGKVMQESGKAALSYARQLLAECGKNDFDFNEHDIHLHVPEGAIPKDGPSAGITMAVAISSALFHTPADTGYAMTGEISLLGNVLPIGGLKEKILAAKRANLKKMILPENNAHNVNELKNEITKGLTINYVSSMEEVIQLVIPSLIQSKHKH